ncbi:penicillin-binding protein 2 [Anaerobacillus sp. CMMVII]|uniref:penicillin-binding transpeptidase domain-containing protein n=1 Tax=Anaerobacillus sp. CMMVII TaxID=2755588 RepID=UPI0021B7F5FE|nr:penicillin-binding protein 2 [Anaerobacillus sp. CMMVII]MCT8137719.1 penicillin-binding protein 2 [Anaerobacillus sp. CMMVII]
MPLKAISRDDTQLLEELMNIPGVTYQVKKARVYPYNEATAHLTGYLAEITAEELEKHKDKGYTANSMIGKAGLELIYEEKLRGELGGKIWIETEAGVEKDVVAEKPAANGEDIYLTIDSKVQTALYRQLEGEVGTAVALHPLTGEVLSMVSSPTYDPNKFVLGMSSQERTDLLEDAAKPLLNRFTHTFTPGSTIKPMIAAIALEDGWDTNEKRAIEGHIWQKDSTWGNYSVRRVTDPNHDVDLTDALVYSDNIYFAQMAIELGIEKLEAGLREFGFDDSLPFEYPLTKSKIANERIDSEMRLADTGYGQGQMLISPLHLALLYTTFVNEGSIPKPTLLKTDRELSYWKEGLVAPENASYILEGLKDVVHHPRGTAAKAKMADIPLAGKTGTTEHKEVQGEKGRETGWFVAMNTDNPELLVLLMVDNIENRGGSGFVVTKVKEAFLEVFSR